MRTCKIRHEGMVMDGEDEILISNDELSLTFQDAKP